MYRTTHTHTRTWSTDLASRNLERRIMTASQVLCFSCIWMELNLRWMIPTMRSISLGEMGRVRDCSLSRFITWVVNSLHACQKTERQKSEFCKRPKFKAVSFLDLTKPLCLLFQTYTHFSHEFLTCNAVFVSFKSVHCLCISLMT